MLNKRKAFGKAWFERLSDITQIPPKYLRGRLPSDTHVEWLDLSDPITDNLAEHENLLVFRQPVTQMLSGNMVEIR